MLKAQLSIPDVLYLIGLLFVLAGVLPVINYAIGLLLPQVDTAGGTLARFIPTAILGTIIYGVMKYGGWGDKISNYYPPFQ